jgi:large subunit ribosomal protein L14
MKAISSKISNALNIGSYLIAADNSGAKIVKITGVKKKKSRRGRQFSCGIGDWVKVSVREGIPDMKGKVFDAVVIRQKKPIRRKTGERIAFTDNAVALLKDEKGNPKGTQIKGPVPKEVSERWKEVAKIASISV